MLLNDERPCISIQLVLEHDISPTDHWLGMLFFDDSPQAIVTNCTYLSAVTIGTDIKLLSSTCGDNMG